MTKFTKILWGGVIALTLTACGTDSVYDEIDQQNADMNAPPSFNENDPGNTHGDNPGSGLIWQGDDYYSPWDIWFIKNNYGDKNLQPNYIFSTLYTGEKEGAYNNYKLEVYAYVGLAYFDGDNDGFYKDLATSSPTVQYNLASGAYPNLYAGNKEVGNLIKTAVPIEVSPNESIRVEDKEKHLLIPGGVDKYTIYNPNNERFIFSGITPQERQLLATYGKVFFYEVIVTDVSTSATIAHEFMQLNPQGYPSGSMPAANKTQYWQPVYESPGAQMTGNAPGGLGAINLYHLNSEITTGTSGTIWTPIYSTSYVCDSREVIFDLPLNMHRVPLSGTDYLVLEVLGSSSYGWLNSSIYLHVE